LNSLEKPHLPATECLRDGVGLVRWLQLIGAIGEQDAARLYAMDRNELDHVAGRARHLREWLRGMLARQRESGAAFLPQAALQPLKTLLAEGDWFFDVEDGSTLDKESAHPLLLERVRWTSAAQALQPIARAIADLFVREDLTRVKHCAGNGCSILFIDRTKASKRRWCSMALCGNRAKSATHRARASDSS
jgi:predicted RNA-binding Zn ribbon-like protein